MKIGLHTLFSPVYQYPDGSVHPSNYDWKLFNHELNRPPGLTPTNRRTWVDAIKAGGRVPIALIEADRPLDTGLNADYFEIGNEMNYNSAVSPETFASQLKLRCQEIRTAKPSAKIILGGTDSWQNEGSAAKWLAKMMVALNGAAPWDIFGVHLYPHGNTMEIDRIPQMLNNIWSFLWAWRIETKPIWCTEVGILQELANFRSMPRVVQTDWITRVFKHAQAGGCAAVVWYAADQNEMGLGHSPSEITDSVALWNAVTGPFA